MRSFRLAWALGIALVTAFSRAAMAERIELSPPGSEVGFRAYGLGLLPLDGKFNRFHGWLSFTRADHEDCAVMLRVEVQSLTMGQVAIRDNVLGPGIMDAARYPVMTYTGTCQAALLQGMLDMHGITRPFALSMDWEPRKLVAMGSLRRDDWGMSGRPFLAGPTVRINVTVPLPAQAMGQ